MTQPAQRGDHKPSVQTEDEDLFNFPIIEMTLEGLREVGHSVEASADILVKKLVSADVKATEPMATATPIPSPTSVKPVAAPTPATTSAAGHTSARASAPAKDQVAPAHATAQRGATAYKPATVTLSQQPTSTSPVAPSGTNPSDVLVPFLNANARLQEFARSRALWIGLGAILVLNGAMFAWLFSSSTTFKAGLDGLRNELGTSVREFRVEAARAGAPTLAAEPKLEIANPEPAPRSDPSELADSYERTTLALAQREIDNRAFAAARKRLYRLLALADRIEPGLRAETEAQAGFLVADSYRLQGVAREQRQ